MPDRRDDWGCSGGDGTQHSLNVEGAEVITRSTATCQKEHADGVGATAASLLHGAGVDSCDRLGDLLGGARTLHRGMYNDQTSERSLAAQHPQNVVQHGTRGGGDQADSTRRMWNESLAGRVEETLRLQRALQRLQLSREEAHATGSLHSCGDQLIAAPRTIEIDAATNDDNLADCGRLLARANRSAEPNYIECGLFISQREVLMAGRAAHGALHLASNDAIG